jgi:membrane-associated protease RseP (regulator of RpoE activity)
VTNVDTTAGPEPASRPVPEHPDRHAPEPTGTSAARLGMLVASVVLLGVWAGVSALIVVLAIVIIIFLHELGHFVTARAAGMKCTEFFIGFGPRVWSFHRGETEYGIKAIPAGAYVKVIGMTNLEEVDPADEARTYRQKPYWRRMSVAVAGSAMHFLIALACLFGFFVGVGVPQDDIWEVGRLAAGDAESPSPAGDAGVEVGDQIVAFEGVSVETFDDLREQILARSPGDDVTISVVRDGRPLDLAVSLGQLDGGNAFLGVGPTYPAQRESIGSAITTTVTEFGTYSKLTVEAIVRIFSPSGLANFVGLAADTARPPVDGPVTSQPLEEQGDRVLSIYGAARLGTQMTDTGVAGLLAFLALINIFIGIFNLVPLLPLDGGHVAIATYEKVRELLSRSTARYHADVSKLIPLTYLVIFVLVGVGVIALYLDIANPIDLPN